MRLERVCCGRNERHPDAPPSTETRLLVWRLQAEGFRLALREDGRSVLVTPGLVAVAEFADAETHSFADTIFRLLKGGFLRATSVGFRPLEYVENATRRGYDFLRQTLLEFSVCNVPANSSALVIDAQRSAHVDAARHRAWLAGRSDAPCIELADDDYIEVDDALYRQAMAAARARSRRLDSAHLSGLLGERREERYDIDPAMLRATVHEIVRAQLARRNEIVQQTVERTLNRIRGKVD